jgi:hypothetical protein
LPRPLIKAPLTTPADEATHPQLPPIRYIKLGRGGAFAPRSLEAGELHFSHRHVPHELALSGDKKAIAAHLAAQGQAKGKASSYAREVMDFYNLGPETIWFTFFNGQLWWAHAEPEVIWLGEQTDKGEKPPGLRYRRTRGPWCNNDELGRPLKMDELSSLLTKVAAFRQTICTLDPEAEHYFREKLEGDDDPYIDIARNAERKMAGAAERFLTRLHWTDLEILADLLLSRSGWLRVSTLGGTMKDADLVVEQVATREVAMVQVKASASQSVVDDYIGRLDRAARYSRLIFVCGSPDGGLSARGRHDVTIWSGSMLAEMAVRQGLMDFLIARQR